MFDWFHVTIRDCLTTHFAGEWGDDPTPGNASVLRATNVSDEMHVELSNGAARSIRQRKLNEKRLINGDILLEASGGSGDKPVGRVAFFETDKAEAYIVSNFFRTLRPNTSVVAPKFLCWLLHWFYKQPPLKAMQQQTTGIINLKLDQYLSHKICIPIAVGEQQAIADILDTLDTQIRQTEAIIAKLKQVKQGLLNDLLTRGIDANGQLRPPREQAPELYQDSPLGWIPVAWEAGLLGDIAKRGSGHTPDKNIPAYWNGGIKWVSLADSNKLDDHYIATTDKEISEAGIANSSAVMHKKGTVVLSRDAGIGKSAILADDMAVSQHFMAWHCSPRLSNDYLYFWLQYMKPTFEAIAIGSTIKTIGLPYFKTLLIPVPPSEEQNKIAEILLAARQKLKANKGELIKLKKQKIGLMDDLLTGRVRVTELTQRQLAS